MNMMRLKLLFIFLLLFFPIVNASFADVVITVESDGLVKITGNTDNLELLNLDNTYALTNKLDRFWYFDINISNFDKLYYKVVLPKDYEINNLISINNTSISSRNNQINIVGYDLNNNLQISIKYSKTTPSSFKSSFLIVFLSILLIILIIIYLYLFGFKKDKNKKIPDLKLKNLNLRQTKILTILKKEKEISQNKLLLLLNIPKSSLSRNISSLESKGYIVRKKSGITFLIRLRE
jgi:hypothetical protein